MITISSIIGNIHRDSHLNDRYLKLSSKSERITISRLESQRVRMRKTTDKGTDIAITLPSGSRLHHGDVIVSNEDKIVLVELEKELVAVITTTTGTLHGDEALAIPVRIGHTIGNLHRPIKVDGHRIVFPIQAESEVDMFRKLFGSLMHHLEIKSDTMVFEPEESMDVHEH